MWREMPNGPDHLLIKSSCKAAKDNINSIKHELSIYAKEQTHT